MRIDLQIKYAQLKEFFQEHEEVVLAYSGEVNSALLLKIAKDELDDEVIAIIAKSESMPEREFEDAIFIAREIGVEPIVINTREIESRDYYSNTEDRCFHCKKHIFGSFMEFMQKNMLLHLVDEANYADSKYYKLGIGALKDYDVISPLKDIGFTKEDIRELSKELGLSIWEKEAAPCLASRIAYNDTITVKKIRMIDSAEEYLCSLEFTQVIARMNKKSLRIEVNPSQVERFSNPDFYQQIASKMKKIGFKNISIDSKGYQMSSMNEQITENNYL